jgi:hypothetical protein
MTRRPLSLSKCVLTVTLVWSATLILQSKPSTSQGYYDVDQEVNPSIARQAQKQAATADASVDFSSLPFPPPPPPPAGVYGKGNLANMGADPFPPFPPSKKPSLEEFQAFHRWMMAKKAAGGVAGNSGAPSNDMPAFMPPPPPPPPQPNTGAAGGGYGQRSPYGYNYGGGGQPSPSGRGPPPPPPPPPSQAPPSYVGRPPMTPPPSQQQQQQQYYMPRSGSSVQSNQVPPLPPRVPMHGGSPMPPPPIRGGAYAQQPEIEYSDHVQGNLTDQDVSLLDWLFTNGVNSPGIIQQQPVGATGKGLFVTKNVKKGEVFFTVPVYTFLYTESPMVSPLTFQALTFFRMNMRVPGFPLQDLDLTEMALLVYMERKNPNSFFAPYLDTLQDPDCPAFYSPEEISSLQGSYLESWRTYFLRGAFKNFERLLAMDEFLARFVAPGAARDVQVEEFLWATSTVLQRSFSWGPRERRGYLMVPWLDMVNHKRGTDNDYTYRTQSLSVTNIMRDRFAGTPRGSIKVIQFAADADKEAGEQVFISYTDTSTSAQLLLQYGFSDGNSTHDYLMFDLGESNPVVTKAAEMLDTRVESIVKLDGLVDIRFLQLVAVALVNDTKASRTAANRVAEHFNMPHTQIVESDADQDESDDAVAVPKGATLVSQVFSALVQAIDQRLARYPSSLEADTSVLADNERTSVMNRNEYAARMFTAQSKQFQVDVKAQLLTFIATLESDQLPPVRAKTYHRRDWPIAMIPMMQDDTAIILRQRRANRQLADDKIMVSKRIKDYDEAAELLNASS